MPCYLQFYTIITLHTYTKIYLLFLLQFYEKKNIKITEKRKQKYFMRPKILNLYLLSNYLVIFILLEKKLDQNIFIAFTFCVYKKIVKFIKKKSSLKSK